MRYLNQIIIFAKNLLRGEFIIACNMLARKCPNWLFRCNKAQLMYTDAFRFFKQPPPDISIKIGEISDIDDIIRISSLKREKIEYLLKSGVTCFLAAKSNSAPASITWNATGRCYIRGLGFEYDFGQDGAYGFWSYTEPEARGQGLHYALMAAKATYAYENGARHFYGIIEYDNKLSYDLRIKTGYVPVMQIYFVQLFMIKFTRVVDMETGKSRFKIFCNYPGGKVIII